MALFEEVFTQNRRPTGPGRISEDYQEGDSGNLGSRGRRVNHEPAIVQHNLGPLNTCTRTVSVMFAEERPALLPLPLEPFRYYQYCKQFTTENIRRLSQKLT